MKRIKEVTEYTEIKNGKTSIDYIVEYATRKTYHYKANDNLPMTVVDFIMNAECTTKYGDQIKITTYR